MSTEQREALDWVAEGNCQFTCQGFDKSAYSTQISNLLTEYAVQYHIKVSSRLIKILFSNPQSLADLQEMQSQIMLLTVELDKLL
jgi:hypothetical protein